LLESSNSSALIGSAGDNVAEELLDSSKIESIEVIENRRKSTKKLSSKSSNSEKVNLADVPISEDDSSDQGDNIPLVTRRYSSSEKIGLFYGSTTGNSEEICV
jgi:hypothetical protein